MPPLRPKSPPPPPTSRSTVCESLKGGKGANTWRTLPLRLRRHRHLLCNLNCCALTKSKCEMACSSTCAVSSFLRELRYQEERRKQTLHSLQKGMTNSSTLSCLICNNCSLIASISPPQTFQSISADHSCFLMNRALLLNAETIPRNGRSKFRGVLCIFHV